MRTYSFVSLFPEVLRPFLEHSVLGRAVGAGLVRYRFANPRDFAYDRHAKVDDSPFGGQPGMLLRPEPVALALESLMDSGEQTAVVMTDPAAPPFTQASAQELSGYDDAIFLCGHYEGIDDRVRQRFATHSFSIGDYVLTNGEMPALVMTDAVVRLLPGVLGSQDSLEADSHSDGLLSAPNFTRPETWRGMPVPEVLKSGDHRAISKWRRAGSLKTTLRYRPDLLARARLEKGDLDMLSS
jgi:tRNA (guanine37-N1)-methyltransferase